MNVDNLILICSQIRKAIVLDRSEGSRFLAAVDLGRIQLNARDEDDDGNIWLDERRFRSACHVADIRVNFSNFPFQES